MRIFIENKTRLIQHNEKNEKLQKEVYREIEDVIDNYPKNLHLKDLLIFLLMPVLCYQFKYPRTNRIRKSHVLKYLAECLICFFLMA